MSNVKCAVCSEKYEVNWGNNFSHPIVWVPCHPPIHNLLQQDWIKLQRDKIDGLCCTALHCTAMHCTALYWTALHCAALHFTALHCSKHRTDPYFNIQHYIPLQCTVPSADRYHSSPPKWPRWEDSEWNERRRQKLTQSGGLCTVSSSQCIVQCSLFTVHCWKYYVQYSLIYININIYVYWLL